MTDAIWPNTLEVICKVVSSSERRLRSHVKKYYNGVGETFITTALMCNIGFDFKKKVNRERLGTAFCKDLSTYASTKGVTINLDAVDNLSKRVSFEVKEHNIRVEGKTGGDFGLTLSLPNFDSLLQINSANSRVERGLLCQAKLNCKHAKLGENQEQVLKQHLGYLAIVMYSYCDDSMRESLLIDWLLGPWENVGHIQRVITGLRGLSQSDYIGPPKLKLRKVVKNLGAGLCGSNSESVIRTIRATGVPTFEFMVIIPDGFPSQLLEVEQFVAIKPVVEQHIYLRNG